ncbi:MAG: glycoside hydrolase family 13 protein [Actinomycetes bacterium]
MPRPDTPANSQWWRDAVCYEIYVRSFADANGDGVGDLAGIRQRLDHLVRLGVDALWLTPFYPSPMADHGYDVADPRAVDPLFGTLEDFDALVRDAHARSMRVMVDVVPNHSSSAHPWFLQALADGPGSAARERYLFRPGKGPNGDDPPNNWQSVFGGPAWSRVTDGEWYLHLFAPEQPDLNWRHPDVAADYEQTLRFWLGRGVDGFRIDVAHGLFKAPDLPDVTAGSSLDLMGPRMVPVPMWDQPEVHDVYRRWHGICADYDNDPVLVGEVWIGDPRSVARYVRPDELQLAFNFGLLFSRWDCAAYHDAIAGSLRELGAVGAPTTWVMSNHDVQRQASRFGPGEVGQQRARAAALLLLALPGPVFLYQGDELGLPEVHVPDAALQDPIWTRSGHTIRGRDGCRVPLPWGGDVPPYEFSPPEVETWLPMPTGWGPLTVGAQSDQPASMLELYRRALALRRAEPALGDGPLHWQSAEHGDVLDFVRPAPDGAGVRCLVNFAAEPIGLPRGQPLLSSAPLPTGQLPADTAVWLRV